jgi:hypothetical protein
VSNQVLRAAWYRFRTTFRRRRSGYLSLIVLIALVGGVAMGALTAARRTQSSFPTYLASTSPSDLSIATGLYSTTLGNQAGYSPGEIRTISQLPRVKRVESYAGFSRNVLVEQRGALVGLPQTVNPIGSVDGEFFDQDRVTVVAGRMANPDRANEDVISEATAARYGVHVGQINTLDFYTNAETYLPTFGTPSVRPYLRMNIKVVGIVVFSNELVQDDIDALSSQYLLFTPALTRKLTQCCTTYTFSALRVSHGVRDLATVESELDRAAPGITGQLQVTSLLEGKAERAIRPESIALGVLGGAAAAAPLLIAAQLIGRQFRYGAEDLAVLRALGADRATTTSDGLIGILGAVVIGSFLAAGVAIGLSPLSPIGPVRPVYPSPGFAFDWTVLGFGLLVLIVGLCAVAAALAYREATRRTGSWSRDRRSILSRAASTSAISAPAAMGIRFALDPGTGKNAVPVRSAIVGAALAVVVLITTVTFGASLNTLVSHPRLYGWNWNYALSADLGDIPGNQAAALLAHDPNVSAWTGVYFSALALDGQTVQVLGARPGAAVQPPILSGHPLEGANQVVLGATTLADLHKRVGDLVNVTAGSRHVASLRIVGTATMPTTGAAGSSHLQMGIGALLDFKVIPGPDRNLFNDPVPGPNAILIRLRPGSSPRGSVASLKRIAAALPDGPLLESVQRPAEIVNFRSMGTTPAVLGAGLGIGAIVALGLTLMASVRRRRHEFALLKTLGFTGRQVAATVAWQSSVAVAIGTVVGIPIGIGLGRFLWTVFAREINAVPAPSVPALTVVFVALGALALANAIGAVPGRIAARTPAALLLRTE